MPNAPRRRLQARLIAALLAISLGTPAVPCTTFVMAGGHGPLFGRNYDFEFGEALVVVNPRGLKKSSDTGGARWTARHGSVTFNQYGIGHPTGGVNEAGLVVELMWLDGSRYPEADARPTVATLEFIQYLLDRSATLDDALKAAGEVRITGRTPLHFLVADRSGQGASVEFLEGRMVVHRGDRMPVTVLANDDYASALARLPLYREFGGPQSLPQDAGSLSRFARAAAGVRRASPQAGPAQAFELLDGVAQAGFTHWQIVYELGRGMVHYRTAAQRSLRRIELSRIDFACAAGMRLLNVDEGEGDMSGRWQPYSRAVDEAQLRIAYRKTSFLKHIPAEAAIEDAKSAEKMRCS
ncbi:linear amide C-N hydrolase [Piscinibacter sp. XHJ-5]|uniref:linear amide C-N hydrolase n=1 Tax=Piscinibacter sp. XHJ-5 TaxID=3037797 RepID=UPI00245305DD|nr:linear amide C-N hydrolase [Piscinibacter sp. XHJ-5]